MLLYLSLLLVNHLRPMIKNNLMQSAYRATKRRRPEPFNLVTSDTQIWVGQSERGKAGHSAWRTLVRSLRG